MPKIIKAKTFKIVQRHPRLVVKYHGFLIERFIGGSAAFFLQQELEQLKEIDLGPKDYPRYQVLGPTGHPDEYRPIGVSYRYRREAAKFIDDFVNGVAYKDGTSVRDPRKP